MNTALGKTKFKRSVISVLLFDLHLNSMLERLQVVRMNEEEHLRNEKMYMAELDHPFINRLIRTYKDQTHVRSS